MCHSRSHSATGQFFINSKDNPFLNYRSADINGWGYCVFGEVIAGMDVVDLISDLPTTQRMGHADVPADPVIIEQAQVLAG